MALYHSADHALARYLRLRSSLQDVRGQDVSFGSGWSDHCANPRCPSNRSLDDLKWREPHRIESHGEMRCYHCGDLWHFRPPGIVRTSRDAHRVPRGEPSVFKPEAGRAVRPKGSAHHGSGVGTASRLHGRFAELALLGVVLGERPGGRKGDAAVAWRMSAEAWEDHLAVWVAYRTGPDGLLELAQTHRPQILRLGERADDRGASAVVNRARDVVEARLDARLLLERRPVYRDKGGIT